MMRRIAYDVLWPSRYISSSSGEKQIKDIIFYYCWILLPPSSSSTRSSARKKMGKSFWRICFKKLIYRIFWELWMNRVSRVFNKDCTKKAHKINVSMCTSLYLFPRQWSSMMTTHRCVWSQPFSANKLREMSYDRFTRWWQQLLTVATCLMMRCVAILDFNLFPFVDS